MLHALAMPVLRLIRTRGKMSIQKIIKFVFRFNDDNDIIIIIITTRQAPLTRPPHPQQRKHQFPVSCLVISKHIHIKPVRLHLHKMELSVYQNGVPNAYLSQVATTCLSLTKHDDSEEGMECLASVRTVTFGTTRIADGRSTRRPLY